MATIPFVHNVSDLGLILYIVLCIYFLNEYNWKLIKIPIGKNISYFYLFILLTIFIDVIFKEDPFVKIILFL